MKVSPRVEVILVDNKRWNKIVKNQIKFIEVAKEWMHGCVMENVRKIKMKLENIWIDLIRSIYAPYTSYSFVSLDMWSPMMPAGWTRWPPVAPLVHPDMIVTHTCTNSIWMNGSLHFFGTCELSLDTIVHMATSLNVAHMAASEDGTVCTPQPCPKTWLLYECCLILRHIWPCLHMWLLLW